MFKRAFAAVGCLFLANIPCQLNARAKTLQQKNYQGFQCRAAKFFKPPTSLQTSLLVKWALRRQLPVKAVSSKMSHSGNEIICPGTAGVTINVGDLNQVIHFNSRQREITVGPAITMGEVSHYLHERGFGLLNHIPLKDVTAAGSIATAAHGSSLKFASGIHDMVKRLKIVDGLGQFIILEGERAQIASAHLGLLGVVVEVTFRIVRQYKVRVGVETFDDKEFLPNMINHAKKHDYVSVKWFPHSQRVIKTFYDRVDSRTKGQSYSTSWHSSAAEQQIIKKISQAANSNRNGFIACNIEKLRSKTRKTSHKSQIKKTKFHIGYSHNMFTSTCVGKQCPWNNGIKVYNPEIAIGVSDFENWLQDAQRILAKKRACFPVSGILFRFSKASHSLIGMNAGKDVVYIEHHIPRHFKLDHHEVFSSVFDEIHQMTLTKYQGRPHWGKNYPVSFALMHHSAYPRLREFLTIKEQLDPFGLFENRFFNRFMANEGLPVFPRCAVTRQCLCSDDSHCGKKHRCVSGYVFSTTKICRPQ